MSPACSCAGQSCLHSAAHTARQGKEEAGAQPARKGARIKLRSQLNLANPLPQHVMASATSITQHEAHSQSASSSSTRDGLVCVSLLPHQTSSACSTVRLCRQCETSHRPNPDARYWVMSNHLDAPLLCPLVLIQHVAAANTTDMQQQQQQRKVLQ
jgi:hypothetical protein